MAERSSLTQGVQLGAETVAGVPVAATRRLTALSIEPSPNNNSDTFRPSGSKFATLTTQNQEWTTAAITGKPTYTESIFFFASLINNSAPTVNGDGSFTWEYSPGNATADAPLTMTVEHGDNVRADRFAYGLINEGAMTFSRTAVDITGGMIGAALEDGISLTPNPTSIELVPILPSEICVYQSNDVTQLGQPQTKLHRVMSANWNFGSRFTPFWAMDCAENSFVNHIESVPDLSLSITMAADSEGMELLNNMRTGDTVFTRVEAISKGREIAPGVPYKFTLDMAGQVNDTDGGFSDQDGAYSIGWSVGGVFDPTWGQALNIKVTNDIAAL